jgi:tetratricopeptide (TPR) repeat protein
MRERMGQLSLAAQEYAGAAEDWLSSAECYLQACAQDDAVRALEGAQKLEAAGHLPPGRGDVTAALREREEGVRRLRRKIEAFWAAWRAAGFKAPEASEDALAFLRRQVRDLPGFAMLHFLIARQAGRLGRQDLAARHLMWAARFDPGHETYTALHGRQLITAGRLGEAEQLGRSFLTMKPDSTDVRLMLALALVAGSAARPSGFRQAIEVLRPVADRSQTNLNHRVIALALSLVLHRLLGEEGEAARLQHEIDEMDRTVADAKLKSVIAVVRTAGGVSLNGAAQPQAGFEGPVHESGLSLFFASTDPAPELAA